MSRFTYDPSPYLRRIWKNYPRSHKADYTRADGIVGYAWIARYTLEFLDGYLKHDAQAMAFLKTTAGVGVPPHMMTVDFRAAKGIPANLRKQAFALIEGF